MPQREGFPPGVPCWIDVATPDPEQTAAFYAGVFGWEVGDARDMGGEAPERHDVGTRGAYRVARLADPHGATFTISQFLG